MTPYQTFVAKVACEQCGAAAGSLCAYPGKTLPANAARVHLSRITLAQIAHASTGGNPNDVWALVANDPEPAPTPAKAPLANSELSVRSPRRGDA